MARAWLAAAAVLVAFPALAADKTVKVACVGDSITFGAAVEERERNNYPTVLGKLLGDGYEVKNFGVSGATLLNAGDLPYTKQGAYTDALKYNPDVVVVMLGTNDSKPQNWKKADDFAKDYEALVKAFKALDGKPTVYVCTPPVAFEDHWGITEKVVAGEVKPKVEAVAKEMKVPLIDVYAAYKGKDKLFADGIHPNAEGAKLLAETVHKAIAAKKE